MTFSIIIEHNVVEGTFAHQTNMNPSGVVEVLTAYLQMQAGQDADTREPKIRDVYQVAVQIDLATDNIQAGSDCGNHGLKVGIVAEFLKHFQKMNEVMLQSELPGLELINRGKVRDLYRLGDYLLIVTTDRVSAFDVGLAQGIPGKGAVLTRLSKFWFEFLADIQPHHLVATDLAEIAGISGSIEGLYANGEEFNHRVMLVKRLTMFPCECIVRGYLAGSGWKDYGRTGSVRGHALPPGLRDCVKLREPLFTPSTKAVTGHDENISVAQLRDLVGKEHADGLEECSLRIYQLAAEYTESRGVILADTKFEFGYDPDNEGEIVLADEVLTPDSSRYWRMDTYQPGVPQVGMDKQALRNWLAESGWNKEPPAPAVPGEVVQATAAAYAEITEIIIG